MITLALWIFVFGPFCAITAYIVVTAAKKIRDEGKADQLSWWVMAVIYVWGIIGVPCDMLLNYTYARIKFKEWPEKGEWMLTARLKRYRKLPDDDWRKQQAIKGWSWVNLFEAAHW